MNDQENNQQPTNTNAASVVPQADSLAGVTTPAPAAVSDASTTQPVQDTANTAVSDLAQSATTDAGITSAPATTDPVQNSVPSIPAAEPPANVNLDTSTAPRPEIEPLVPLARDYEPPQVDTVPSRPEDISSDMVADFLSQQSSTTTAENIAPSAPQTNEVATTSLNSETSSQPVDIWDSKDTEIVTAEPIIPDATTTATTTSSTIDDLEATPKQKASWLPVIVLGLLVIVTGIIVLILLASSQTPTNTNPRPIQTSSASSITSEGSTTSSISQPIVPAGWIESTDALLGIKFALPPQASYTEVEIPAKVPAYTAAEIAAFNNKPLAWYYTPTGVIKFANTNLDAQYMSLNYAPGMSSGIGTVCEDDSMCLVKAAINVYRFPFAGSIEEFAIQFGSGDLSSTQSSTSLSSTSIISSSFSSLSSNASITAPDATTTSQSNNAGNSVMESVFGLPAAHVILANETYLAVKQGNNIYAVSIFTVTTEYANIVADVIKTLNFNN